MKRILLLLSAVALLTGGCAQKPAANTATATPGRSITGTAAKTTKKLAAVNQSRPRGLDHHV